MTATSPHRVLLIGPVPPPVGGLERMVLTIAQTFAPGVDKTWTVDRLSPGEGVPQSLMRPKLVKQQVHQRALEDAARRMQGSTGILHMVTAWGDNFWRAADFCAAGRAAGWRVVLHLQSGKFATWFDEQMPSRQQQVREVMTQIDALAVLSPGWITQLSSWVDPANCVVIPNVADASHWPVQPHPGPDTPEARPFRWVYAGRIERPKGIWELLTALEGLNAEVRLYGRVMGDGTATRLRGAPVRLMGEATPHALCEGYAWADALVFPSHYEGLPVAMVEAMLSGLPVIATRVGAIPEMLADLPWDQTIPAEDPEALRAAMTSLMSLSPETRLALGAANRTRAEARYSIDALREACHHAWQRVAGDC
ncbi:MAG: hypothetical protein GEEBNDBF_02248 [bacterium]|nr:hypothetical protein [bacterium]